MPSRLVTVVSYDNLPEAEWAQSRLAQAEIQSSLTNGNLVNWFWQFRDAVGGIKLQVPESDVETAVDLLYWDVVDDANTTACPACSEVLDAGWEVCWRCGKDFSGTAGPDSTAAPSTLAESSAQDQSPVWQGIAVVATGLFLLFALGLTALFVWCGCIAIGRVVFTLVAASNHQLGQETISDLVVDGDIQPTRGRCDRFALRAWQSAMFGYLYFPPLAVYAIWLALRVNVFRDELSRKGRIYLTATFLLAGMVALFWSGVLGLFFFHGILPFMWFDNAYQPSPWTFID